jgi:ferric-dicitrate binding protein FerR (iron transport regulator)
VNADMDTRRAKAAAWDTEKERHPDGLPPARQAQFEAWLAACPANRTAWLSMRRSMAFLEKYGKLLDTRRRRPVLFCIDGGKK